MSIWKRGTCLKRQLTSITGRLPECDGCVRLACRVISVFVESGVFLHDHLPVYFSSRYHLIPSKQPTFHTWGEGWVGRSVNCYKYIYIHIYIYIYIYLVVRGQSPRQDYQRGQVCNLTQSIRFIYFVDPTTCHSYLQDYQNLLRIETRSGKFFLLPSHRFRCFPPSIRKSPGSTRLVVYHSYGNHVVVGYIIERNAPSIQGILSVSQRGQHSCRDVITGVAITDLFLVQLVHTNFNK